MLDGSNIIIIFFFIGIKDVNTVNLTNSLADLGMDSLMGAEIKQTLERNYDVVLSAQEIRNLTFGKLKDLASGGGSSEPSAAPASSTTNGDDQVNNYADSESIQLNTSGSLY